MQLPFKIARPFAAPPGIPAERAEILVKAFMDTQRDPEYLAEARKMGLDVSPVPGSAVARLIADAVALPHDLVKVCGPSFQSGLTA